MAVHWLPRSVGSCKEGKFKHAGISLHEPVQESLNFTTTILRPPDGAWGKPADNGDWNGMVGMVKRNEADFGLGEILKIC